MTEPILGFHGQYEFLSNFVWCSVVLDGVVYPSTEHAYQAAKTLDHKERQMICLAKTAGQSKKLGKSVTLRDDWESVKEDVMLDLLIQKFSKPTFSSQLLETGDAYLEETNWWKDRYWGVCDGVGKNRLGHMLMRIRSLLKEIN